MGRKIRIAIYVLLAAALVAAALWLFGPRPVADTTITFQSASLPEDLDTYLSEKESVFADIRPNNGKQIVWAYPKSRARTPLAIVYVHGFSASPAEIRPVPDEVAKRLGANLFLTRLAGHGRSGDAMADASVHAWIEDYAEAIAIGRRLGEKVVVIATSTGASLATWAALQPELSQNVAGYVFVSPNYGVQASGSFLLTAPFAPALVKLVLGERRSFEPRNTRQAENWTTEYPSAALIPMAQIIELARESNVGQVQTPVLFIFSPGDQVVRPDRTRQIADRWGGSTEIVEVTGSADPAQHVIAGDIMSPETTADVAGKISSWAGSL